VVFGRTVHLTPLPQVADRSDRTDALGQRWRRVLSSIDGPVPGDVGLAVFTHRMDYGGGQLWLDELLRRSGAGTRYPCSVIAFSDGPLRQRMEARGIEVHVTEEPSVEDIEQHEGRISELAAYLAPSGPNVVLVNTAVLLSGVEVAHRLDLPVVWAIHESLPPEVLLEVAHGGQVHPAVRGAFFDALRAADALVFEAEATRQMYAPWSAPQRSIVVPYGIDTGAITEYCGRVSKSDARADVGVPPGSRMILVMGTVEPRKAQSMIAQALRFVRHDHPDWIVVFVGGSDSAYCDAVTRSLAETGLAGRARVEPVDADAYRWYRAADVLLSASDMESLPRSMLEAMCFGTPIVSTSVFGVPDLLGEGRCGFLFAPNDLEATISVLDEVLALDDAALRAVGEAGRARVLEFYDSAGYAADLMALCRGFVRDRGMTPDDILKRWGRDAVGQR
jgi:glycosyltransferase involved in cell wall biosynthesis